MMVLSHHVKFSNVLCKSKMTGEISTVHHTVISTVNFQLVLNVKNVKVVYLVKKSPSLLKNSLKT